jgi:hypothetical protein
LPHLGPVEILIHTLSQVFKPGFSLFE